MPTDRTQATGPRHAGDCGAFTEGNMQCSCGAWDRWKRKQTRLLMRETDRTQATPGWRYIPGDGIHDAQDRRVAALSCEGKPMSMRLSFEEVEANGHLIAAAPQMREILGAILFEIKAKDDGSGRFHITPRLLDDARAVLCAANGEG